MSQPKTQILITDIPKEKFDCNWPQQLEDLIFKEQFPQVKPHLEYYTPLAFLNRVVIIFDQEPATLQVYEFLKTKLVGEPVKLAFRNRVFVREATVEIVGPNSHTYFS